MRELHCRESRMLQLKISDMKTVLGNCKIHGVALGNILIIKVKDIIK